MASFRLQVLAFVRDYIGQWGCSPSYGEIANHFRTSRPRVKKAVLSLARDGLVLRSPGPRGLHLPTERDAAVRVLQALGFQLMGPDGPVTDRVLPDLVRLDYAPDPSTGSG